MRVSLLSQSRKDWVENSFDAGPTQDLEGYRDQALRLQLLYDGGANLSVLGNVHARDYQGSARLFRANIIQPGTNNFVAGFDERKISVDGQNHSELQNYGGSVRIRLWPGRLALQLHYGLETVRTYSRGDIDGGFGASFLPPGASGPGNIPFASESADGIPRHSQFTQEFRLESDRQRGPPAGRPACLPSARATRSRASATTRWLAARRMVICASSRTTMPTPPSAM
jgi:iron complex outermembrane receptor protein